MLTIVLIVIILVSRIQVSGHCTEDERDDGEGWRLRFRFQLGVRVTRHYQSVVLMQCLASLFGSCSRLSVIESAKYSEEPQSIALLPQSWSKVASCWMMYFRPAKREHLSRQCR